MQTPETTAMCSIEKPISIKNPNKAVPKAVANTINAVVKALIDPIYLTPYISAQVDDPNTLAKPLEIPINPKKINAEIYMSMQIKTNIENNKGKFININNFLLVNLSIKNPEISNVKTDKIEYAIND